MIFIIPISRMAVILIEVTNHCNLKCNNCTRFCDVDHENRYFMSMEDVRKAIKSVQGFKQQIGIMGGEPTLHPQFRDICWEMTKIPLHQRSLWTNGCNYDEYRDVIESTFLPENIIFNNHEDDSDTDIHHPLRYKSKDLIKDDFLRGLLTANCWVQWRWGASITPKGGYFCEVAAAMDMRDGGDNGIRLTDNWWNKDPNEFLDQVIKFCPNCSGCVPMDGEKANSCAKNIKVNQESILKKIKSGWYPYDHRKLKKDGNDIL